jgi:hypothetical protein
MTVIMILAIYGIAYTLRNINGPFNVIGIARNKLISMHVFFYELLMCPWCVGTHIGWIVYLIGCDHFSIGRMTLWAFAGAVVVPLMDELFSLFGELNGAK